MKVTFSAPTDITVQEEIKKTMSEITITQMTDNPDKKEVSVFTKELGRVVLWKGDAYDNIGQWTDADVTSRILEMYA